MTKGVWINSIEMERENFWERERERLQNQKSTTTSLSHSFPMFCSILFWLFHYTGSVWLSANTFFFHHFPFLGKVFLRQWLLNIYIYIYRHTPTERFLREAMEGNKKTASSSSLTLNFLGPIKESSSSSGIFGSIFVPSAKVLVLISVQFCCFELMFRIYKYVMYFLWLFRLDFHCFYFVMFVCFLHFTVLVPILFLQWAPSTVCLSLSLKLSVSISIELIHTPLSLLCSREFPLVFNTKLTKVLIWQVYKVCGVNWPN